MSESLYIRFEQIKKITGWGRTKIYEFIRTLRHIKGYKSHQKNLKLSDFCEYEDLDKSDVLRILNDP
jgi:hypothetical protein